MKKILKVLLVISFIAVSLTGVSFAQGPGMNSNVKNYNYQTKGEGVGYKSVELTDYQIEKLLESLTDNQVKKIVKLLDHQVEKTIELLTDYQIEKILEFRDEFYNDTEELRNELRSLIREIRDLEFRGASNAEIREVEDKLEQILSKINEKRIEYQKNIESILTDSLLETIEENHFKFQGTFNNSDTSNGIRNGIRN
jgi:Spy/CpxP family protein refolding chaperone